MTRLLHGDDQDCLVFSRPTTIIGTWSLRGIAEPLGCRSISADKLQKSPTSAVLENTVIDLKNDRENSKARYSSIPLNRRFGGNDNVL